MAAPFPLVPSPWLESQQPPKGDRVPASPDPHGCSSGRPEASWPPLPLSCPQFGPAGQNHQHSSLAHLLPPASSPATAATPWPLSQVVPVGHGKVFGGEGSHHRSQGGENGLRLFGFYQPLLDQAAIEFLNVCVHTLPIWLAHPDHVLHVQQLRTVRVLPEGREREGQASDRSPVGEGRKRENKRHGSMQFPSHPQADAALLSHALGVRDAGTGGLWALPHQGHSVRFQGAQAREGEDR